MTFVLIYWVFSSTPLVFQGFQSRASCENFALRFKETVKTRDPQWDCIELRP